MRRHYPWKEFLAYPQDVYSFAWSAPLRDLAATLDLSDTGLKKLLASYGVATPPQGLWNKVHAGKPVLACPTAPPRRPGGIGRLMLDPRFAKVLAAAEPISSAGPFESALVPEDLEELRSQELEAMGRVAVPRSLERPHHGLARLLKQEQRRREKVAASGWQWDKPKFDAPLDQRRLRLLNAIFLALGKRGHDGDAYERDGELHASATVGDTRVGFEVRIAGKGRTSPNGRPRAAQALPANTPLAVELLLGSDRTPMTMW